MLEVVEEVVAALLAVLLGLLLVDLVEAVLRLVFREAEAYLQAFVVVAALALCRRIARGRRRGPLGEERLALGCSRPRGEVEGPRRVRGAVKGAHEAAERLTVQRPG